MMETLAGWRTLYHSLIRKSYRVSCCHGYGDSTDLTVHIRLWQLFAGDGAIQTSWRSREPEWFAVKQQEIVLIVAEPRPDVREL